MAVALREAFDGKAVVLTPDLPRHPKEALKLVRKIIDKEQPDLLIGNSCGAFLAQMIGSCGGRACPTGQSVFQDDGVSEGARRRASIQVSSNGRQSATGNQRGVDQ